jgi:hypothetical protein
LIIDITHAAYITYIDIIAIIDSAIISLPLLPLAFIFIADYYDIID